MTSMPRRISAGVLPRLHPRYWHESVGSGAHAFGNRLMMKQLPANSPILRVGPEALSKATGNAGYPSTGQQKWGREARRRAGVRADLPAVRPRQDRDHAHRCLPVLLRMRELPCAAPSQARRLLRLLFLRHGALSAAPGTGARALLPGTVSGSVSATMIYCPILKSRRWWDGGYSAIEDRSLYVSVRPRRVISAAKNQDPHMTGNCSGTCHSTLIAATQGSFHPIVTTTLPLARPDST